VSISADVFREVFAAHYDDLTRFVRRRTLSDHAEDVVEEAFLTLWRQKAMPAQVRPWLFATARNVLLNAERGRQRREALAVHLADHLDVEAPDHAPGIDARMDVIASWRMLSPSDQEVLALAIWEDLPASEAAIVLGCSKPAYLMRLSRAKARLAPRLARPALTAVL
jgi:RNA polymerase sigma factor (sigma-70 family)